jgi:hypothetical protein
METQTGKKPTLFVKQLRAQVQVELAGTNLRRNGRSEQEAFENIRPELIRRGLPSSTREYEIKSV